VVVPVKLAFDEYSQISGEVIVGGDDVIVKRKEMALEISLPA